MDAEATEDPDGERGLAVARSHAIQLMEHFDSVQIIATRHDPAGDGTLVINYGEGNWYARYGSVKEWVAKQEEKSRVAARNE